MIDTRDLPSYYPGYDDYCEPREHKEKYDNFDEYYDELKIREEIDKMEREIIDLRTTKLTIDEIFKLENYVLKNYKLIPTELIGGE